MHLFSQVWHVIIYIFNAYLLGFLGFVLWKCIYKLYLLLKYWHAWK